MFNQIDLLNESVDDTVTGIVSTAKLAVDSQVVRLLNSNIPCETIVERATQQLDGLLDEIRWGLLKRQYTEVGAYRRQLLNDLIYRATKRDVEDQSNADCPSSSL